MAGPRIGLVLGGGGFTGTAFHAGVLAGLADRAGWDARTAEVIVGTSAGSIAAALMRGGLPPADYLARVTGRPMSADGQAVLGGVGPLRQPHRPERPGHRPASPGLLPTIARRPWRYRPGVTVAALLPEGRVPVDEGVTGVADLFPAWPQEATWICAVDLEDGLRVVFGRDATTTMGQAVSASCAIPGFYAPVVIGGRRHVDGGMWSTHNLDLMAGLGLDLVVVSAPMSTADPTAVERATLARLPVNRRLAREAEQVTRSGTRVVRIEPDAGLRQIMGTTTMQLSRRPVVADAAHALVADLVDRGSVTIP
jgi:NTE family protein